MAEPHAALPDRFRDVEHLEDVMTTPSAALTAEFGALAGDLIILGVGGKIGPTLARLAKRAAPAQAGDRGGPLQRTGSAREAARLGHRMHRGRPPRPHADRGAAESAQRGVHGRPQVRLLRQRGPDLGDERACAGAGRRGVRGLAHRRLFDRLRVPLCQRAARRRDRGDAGRPAARRLRQFLPRARRHVPVFLAHARHARPHHPPQLRDRHALRRAARRRARGCTRASRSISPPATSTSSGRATPTPWCCVRSATARCRRARSMSAVRRR